MAQLPTLTAYDPNLIPNKATMTDEEFADAIHPYLNFWNGTTIPEINNWRGTLEQIRQEINDKYIAVKNQAVDGGYSQAYLDTKYNPPMQRTYYVDAVNGDDTNDGSSSYPFKTLKKAIDSVPEGVGRGYVNIIGDYELDSDRIYINQKYIKLQGDGKLVMWTRLSDNYNLARGFLLLNSSLEIKMKNIEMLGKVDSSLNMHGDYRAHIMYVGVCFVAIDAEKNSVDDDNFLILRDYSLIAPYNRWGADHKGLIVLKIGKYNYSGHPVILKADDSANLLNVDYSNAIYQYVNSAYLKIKDSNGNYLNKEDLLANVLYDTNGVPRNVLMNFVP